MKPLEKMNIFFNVKPLYFNLLKILLVNAIIWNSIVSAIA